jgi:hypothetical protein
MVQSTDCFPHISLFSHNVANVLSDINLTWRVRLVRVVNLQDERHPPSVITTQPIFGNDKK